MSRSQSLSRQSSTLRPQGLPMQPNFFSLVNCFCWKQLAWPGLDVLPESQALLDVVIIVVLTVLHSFLIIMLYFQIFFQFG